MITPPSPYELQSYCNAISSKYSVLGVEKVWGVADRLKLQLQQSSDYHSKQILQWVGRRHLCEQDTVWTQVEQNVILVNCEGTKLIIFSCRNCTRSYCTCTRMKSHYFWILFESHPNHHVPIGLPNSSFNRITGGLFYFDPFISFSLSLVKEKTAVIFYILLPQLLCKWLKWKQCNDIRSMMISLFSLLFRIFEKTDVLCWLPFQRLKSYLIIMNSISNLRKSLVSKLQLAGV